jgi:hypothetical protein
MKRVSFYLALLLILALVSPAQAQSETLDTILARAAARGFLTSLTRPELAGLTDFYLLDRLKTEGLVAELQSPPVTGFEITAADWISDVTFQLKATLQPGQRQVAVYTGKYHGRWRVEGIDLPSPPEAEAAATAPSPAVPAGPAPVTGNSLGQLVFQTRSGGDIYLIQADGTGLRRLTHGIDPQLSPDGRQIAFTRWEPRYELFTLNLDGSGEQAWTHGWRQMKSPTWTADGSTLIFSFQSGGRLDSEDFTINLRKAFEQGDDIDIPPEAVGVEIEHGILRYSIRADAYWFLKAIDLSSGQLTDLGTERHSYGPSGHPTQPDQVIYKGQVGLALHDLQTGLEQPITRDFRDHTPVISPDGQWIAVSYWQDGHWEVHTLKIDGSQRQRLTTTPITVLANKARLVTAEVAGKERFIAPENDLFWNNAAPVWSPDGSQIAFVTDRTGQWEIWLMQADGSQQRPMFPNGALDGLNLEYAGVDEHMLSWR